MLLCVVRCWLCLYAYWDMCITGFVNSELLGSGLGVIFYVWNPTRWYFPSMNSEFFLRKLRFSYACMQILSGCGGFLLTIAWVSSLSFHTIVVATCMKSFLFFMWSLLFTRCISCFSLCNCYCYRVNHMLCFLPYKLLSLLWAYSILLRLNPNAPRKNKRERT